MHLIITGVTGLRNRGVEALVDTIVHGLRRRLPEVRLTLMTRSEEYDALRLAELDVATVPDIFALMQRSRKLRWSAQASRWFRGLAPRYEQVVDTIQSADAVIVSGGDVISSDYGDMDVHLEPIRIAQAASVPTVLLAHSIGPFKRDADVAMFCDVARRVSLTTVREPLTAQYMTDTLDLTAVDIQQTADPAFILPALQSAPARNLQAAHGLGDAAPTIALAVSRGIETFSGCNGERHLQAWRAIVRCAVDELGAGVLLIPHVQESSPGNDDMIAATALHRALDFDPRVHIAAGDLRAGEFKTLIQGCELVVAERMHAAIAGLSSGVATLAVGYSVKAEGILRTLLEPAIIDERALIHIDQFLDPQAAVGQLRRAWANRQDTALRLTDKLPAVRAAAERNFDEVATLLGAGSTKAGLEV